MSVRVLVVDDEEDIRDALVAELEGVDYETVVLENGENIVNTVLETRPDVIVLDLMMPKVNGYEAISALKDDPVTQRIPVIVASAATRSGILTAVRELGAADFLQKPWRDGELVWRIDQAIGTGAA